jgi:hypothetical protein
MAVNPATARLFVKSRNDIDELPIISRLASPRAFPARKMWLQKFPHMI